MAKAECTDPAAAADLHERLVRQQVTLQCTAYSKLLAVHRSPLFCFSVVYTCRPYCQIGELGSQGFHLEINRTVSLVFSRRSGGSTVLQFFTVGEM